MKHAIRALGWATTILWILVILFSGTIVYSAMQIRMNFEEEPQVTTSNGMLTMSIPFSINNGGFYDISELNITTRIEAENETVISRSTTLVPLIPRDSTVSEKHDVALSLDDILTKNLTYLLFKDTDLNLDMFVALTYAHAIPIKISSNLTMRWGAPLSNLTIGEISITPLPPYRVDIPLSFDNHAFFSLNGTMRLEIVDGSNLIGWEEVDISVPPGYGYDDTISVPIDSVPEDRAEVHLYFDGKHLKSWSLVMAVE
ncbi:MAG: hypothetical protein ACE5OV_01250 [Candidatus Bathyarchaeia archaeon]